MQVETMEKRRRESETATSSGSTGSTGLEPARKRQRTLTTVPVRSDRQNVLNSLCLGVLVQRMLLCETQIGAGPSEPLEPGTLGAFGTNTSTGIMVTQALDPTAASASAAPATTNQEASQPQVSPDLAMSLGPPLHNNVNNPISR